MNTIFEYVPTLFINRMKATIDILKQVPSFAQSKGMTEEQILDSRLSPDMHPLKKHVQIMADNSKAFCVRLSEIENPVWEDNETTVVELIARLNKAIDFMESHPVTDYQKALDTKITPSFVPGSWMTSTDYMIEFLIPNFLFHASVFYSILRNIGMPLGKATYIGKVNLKPLN